MCTPCFPWAAMSWPFWESLDWRFWGWGSVLLPRRRRFLRVSALGSALVLALAAGALALWAARDFGYAFSLLHHILFNNDLWLLNPETDLMIRHAAGGILRGPGPGCWAVRSALAALAAPLALWCFSGDLFLQSKGR